MNKNNNYTTYVYNFMFTIAYTYNIQIYNKVDKKVWFCKSRFAEIKLKHNQSQVQKFKMSKGYEVML